GIVLLNAAVLVVNAFMVARLPAVPIVHHEQVRRSQLAVLKDRHYVVLCLVMGVILFHGVIFAEIIPLWAITHTDAPKPILGALFALNTVLAVALQVPAARGAGALARAAPLLRRAALASALACPVASFAGITAGAWTVAALGLAVVLVTTTELWN